MTTRSGLLLLILCAASAGCGGSVVFSEDGGDGGAGGDDRPPTVPPGGGGNAPSGPTGPTVSVVSVGPSVTVGAGGCLVTEFFVEPACDDCFLASCCAEAEACVDDFESCVTPEGELDESSPVGAAVVACATDRCAVECGITPGAEDLCGSGIAVNDQPGFMDCFNASCCDTFDLCTDGGAAVDECFSCLNSLTDDLSRCAPSDSCAIEACGSGLVTRNVCGSSYFVRGIEAGLCVERECCDEAVACTADGQQPEACRDCVGAGGGPLCDSLLACQAEQFGF